MGMVGVGFSVFIFFLILVLLGVCEGGIFGS